MALGIQDSHDALHLVGFILQQLGITHEEPVPTQEQLEKALINLTGKANRTLMAGLSADRVRQLLAARA